MYDCRWWLPERQLGVLTYQNQQPGINKNCHFESFLALWFSPKLWMWDGLANQHAESVPFHTYL